MKLLSVISTLSFLLLLQACQRNSADTSTSIEIPELINRPHLIGPEEEMSYMMDTYMSLVSRIQSNPKDLESRLSLAELFMQEARISGDHGYYYPAAMDVIEKVIQENPGAPLKYRALLDLGSVQLSQHQFAAARQTGEQALALNEQSADVYGVLIDANVELGQYDKAVAYADRMASIRPDIRSYSRISYLREIYGEVDGAIEAMKLAVAAGYPGTEQTEWARLTLGHLYERYGHQDSAMWHYEQSLVFRPHYPFAIGAMANLYASKGDYQKADSLNAVAMQLIPELSFYVNQAAWEKERGNVDKAKALNQEIMAMLEDDTKSGHSMSLEYAHVYFTVQDDPKKALASLKEEFSVRPENIDVNKKLCEVYLFTGDLDAAKTHLDKAQRTGTKDPETRLLAGMVLVKTNREAEGITLLKSVFVENPDLNCTFCKEAKSKVL